MEIEYRGANCVVIKGKKTTIVVDPTSNVSAKESQKAENVILATQEKFTPLDSSAFVIDMPGEYEYNDTSVRGIPVPTHIGEGGQDATMYRVETDGVRIAVVGHTSAPIDEDDLENLGVIDIAIVPVGGGGYTLDASDAATVIRQISPKVVIPTHFADPQVKYEVPQEKISVFTNEMGGAHEKSTSFKIKSVSNLPEILTIYELDRTT